LTQGLYERRDAGLCVRVICGRRYEHTDTSPSLALLRARCRRPRCHAAEQRNDLATLQLSKLHPLPPTKGQSITDW
jgi:hypothetical protein